MNEQILTFNELVKHLQGIVSKVRNTGKIEEVMVSNKSNVYKLIGIINYTSNGINVTVKLNKTDDPVIYLIFRKVY